jgi:biopolymer transport protein TolQ
MGLFAAIPAVIAYNRFNSDINHMANQYTLFREECVALLARQIQAGEEYRPVVETKQPRMYLEDDPEYA